MRIGLRTRCHNKYTFAVTKVKDLYYRIMTELTSQVPTFHKYEIWMALPFAFPILISCVWEEGRNSRQVILF